VCPYFKTPSQYFIRRASSRSSTECDLSLVYCSSHVTPKCTQTFAGQTSGYARNNKHHTIRSVLPCYWTISPHKCGSSIFLPNSTNHLRDDTVHNRADKHNWDLCHDYSLNPDKPAYILTKNLHSFRHLFSLFSLRKLVNRQRRSVDLNQ